MVRHVRLIPPPPMPSGSHEPRGSGVVRKAARVPPDLVAREDESEPARAEAVGEVTHAKNEAPTLPPPARRIPREEVPTSPGRPNKLLQKSTPRRKQHEGARAEAVVADLRNDPRREK
jgi:hypothetical protein